MKEITLSNDLNVITAEIKSYKQVAGQAIFEIGRRLKHVKDNDLVHGEWEKYCEEQARMSPSRARMHIKVYEEFKTNRLTSNDLGLDKLYQIATIPQEEREKEHTLSSGETKTVDEMTNRELQEVKRQLKEKERQLEEAKRSEEIALKKLEEAENREPEVIEMEVAPDDYDKYKGGYKALERTMSFYKEQNEELREELKELEELLNASQINNVDDEELEKLKKEKQALKSKVDSSNKLLELQSDIEHFLSVISPKMYTIDFDDLKNEHELLNVFRNTLNGVSDWCELMKNEMPNENILDGVIINE